MNIFVLTRGYYQDDDYHWSSSDGENLMPKLEDFSDLIDSQYYSIVMRRKSSYLELLVTGMPARSERKDFMGRQIRNTVLWRVQTVETEGENIIRRLLIQALANQEQLSKDIDSQITVTEESEFTVNFDKIQQLSSKLNQPLESKYSEFQCKIGGNFSQLRRSLAEEIKEHQLPQREGNLVILTTMKSKSGLKKTEVWRGLSNKISSDDWLTTENNLMKIDENSSEGKKKGIFLLLFLVLLAILLILVLVLKPIPQNPVPEPNQVPEETLSPQNNLSNNSSMNTSKFPLTLEDSGKRGNSRKLPSNCKQAKEMNYWLSPCL